MDENDLASETTFKSRVDDEIAHLDEDYNTRAILYNTNLIDYIPIVESAGFVKVAEYNGNVGKVYVMLKIINQ